MGLPALNGFVGEFMILTGSFRTLGWPAVVATFGVVLAAIYLLKMIQLTHLGSASPRKRTATSPTSRLREMAALVPLCVLMLWIGVAPQAFLKPSQRGARATSSRPTSSGSPSLRSLQATLRIDCGRSPVQEASR